MLDFDTLFRDLDDIGLGTWREPLESVLRVRLADGVHGHLAEWREIVRQLPAAQSMSVSPAPDAIVLSGEHLSSADAGQVRKLLQGLVPWRKGPFRIQNIELDAEWRSDLKWNRIKDHISPLAGRNVLDVGSGNGYYAFRMLSAGAAHVIGIDPGVLFVCQFLALKKMAGIQAVHVLPLRLQDLPSASGVFDTTFSMGVLYHQRDPHAHLAQLRESLRPGGELVLETLVLPGHENEVIEPGNRYARMRNVWHLPTVTALESWLRQAGFAGIQVLGVSTTTTDEQRTTAWMPFESLAEALDPDDPTRTIEGLPAPARAIVTCDTSPASARSKVFLPHRCAARDRNT
jgi:tRNA (mo5U34)-methyltransferase